MFIVVFITLLLRIAIIDSSFDRVWWKWDESFYINVADNIRDGNGFNLDILEYRQVFYKDAQGDVQYIYDYYDHAGRPYYFAGPVYPLFLSGLFSFFHAEPPDWTVIPIIANLILLLLIVYFMYQIGKTLFDSDTAFWIAFTAGLFPALFWYMGALPYILYYLFIVLSFYLLFKNYSWWIIGAVIGLAHLTHGSGIVLFGTFFLYCLIKKQWKNSGKFALAYILMLMPYMIYNQIRLGDFGLGLSFPSSMILSLLHIVQGSAVSSVSLNYSVNFWEVIKYIPNELNRVYKMVHLVAGFLIFFMVGAFKKNKNVLIFVLYIVVSLGGYFYMAKISNDTSIETKYLMPAIFMLIPLAVYGFCSLKPSVFLYSVVQTVLIITAGAVAIEIDVNYNQRMVESQEEIKFHEWVRGQDFDEQTVVLTNAPQVLFLKTGLSGVYIHTEVLDQNTMDYLVEKFDPEYYLIYAYTSQLPKVRRNLTALASDYNLEYQDKNILFYRISE